MDRALRFSPLRTCHGYVHFVPEREPVGTILYLHGYGEAAEPGDGQGVDERGAVRLLRHPLPSHVFWSELANTPLRARWDHPEREPSAAHGYRNFEMVAPQKRHAGLWRDDELSELLETLLPEQPAWHLAGSSYGGQAALKLLAMSPEIRWLSLSLACPARAPLPSRLPPTWLTYGERDLPDILRFGLECQKLEGRPELRVHRLNRADHATVLRQTFDAAHLSWLGCHAAAATTA